MHHPANSWYFQGLLFLSSLLEKFPKFGIIPFTKKKIDIRIDKYKYKHGLTFKVVDKNGKIIKEI